MGNLIAMRRVRMKLISRFNAECFHINTYTTRGGAADKGPSEVHLERFGASFRQSDGTMFCCASVFVLVHCTCHIK